MKKYSTAEVVKIIGCKRSFILDLTRSQRNVDAGKRIPIITPSEIEGRSYLWDFDQLLILFIVFVAHRGTSSKRLILDMYKVLTHRSLEGMHSVMLNHETVMVKTKNTTWCDSLAKIGNETDSIMTIEIHIEFARSILKDKIKRTIGEVECSAIRS